MRGRALINAAHSTTSLTHSELWTRMLCDRNGPLTLALSPEDGGEGTREETHDRHLLHTIVDDASPPLRRGLQPGVGRDGVCAPVAALHLGWSGAAELSLHDPVCGRRDRCVRHWLLDRRERSGHTLAGRADRAGEQAARAGGLRLGHRPRRVAVERHRIHPAERCGLVVAVLGDPAPRRTCSQQPCE